MRLRHRINNVIAGDYALYAQGDNTFQLVTIVSKDQCGDYLIDSPPRTPKRDFRTVPTNKIRRLSLLQRLWMAYFAPIDMRFTGENNEQTGQT